MSIILPGILSLHNAGLLFNASKKMYLKFPSCLCAVKSHAISSTHVHRLSVCAKLRHPIEPRPSLDEGFWKNSYSSMKWFLRDQYKVIENALYHYESCVDDVNSSLFIEKLELPDNFLSWFLITELHVWMCLVRAMREGKEGDVLREKIMVCMWKDIQIRISKLGHVKPQQKKEGLLLLNDQFKTALCAYDEGILGDDRTLAAAIWRTLFCYDCQDPHYLEVLVHYVRKNVYSLDRMSRLDVLYGGKVKWTSLDSILKS